MIPSQAGYLGSDSGIASPYSISTYLHKNKGKPPSWEKYPPYKNRATGSAKHHSLPDVPWNEVSGSSEMPSLKYRPRTFWHGPPDSYLTLPSSPIWSMSKFYTCDSLNVN